ncbi:tRNA (guanosine(46)-N7)-methyltransferase TrmB [Heliophilum fasciatum]|nr:tRNA (guanosine(46)-N7)-methyltransferase TrmB [Heliophilum fasciatum]MCW2277594.1 tRNA (guanine-N7-)-methyltransferase [Heliophilum fasciatum]
MRLRRIAGTKEKIVQHTNYLVLDPGHWRGRWDEFFEQRRTGTLAVRRPLYLELGIGRGTFITTMATRSTDVNWLGAELREEVLLEAIEKANAGEMPNLAFLWIDIERIAELFAPGEVDRIYLHFSDPWPKKRQAKRRLTHPRFLERYKQFLRPGGEIYLKSDNRDLFDFSLTSLADHGFSLTEVSYDWHGERKTSDEAEVMTEYERRFVGMNMPIHRCVAVNLSPAAEPR